ncbi:hypothetical protein KC973_01365 [Candidatus Saccharibacteria bacterium]|nr:hypothetical protein [Candidatus Saccharibacteria bacterium]MCA9337768.1 hypothetical protein [Candidatus Saccharibacteria bacterium]
MMDQYKPQPKQQAKQATSVQSASVASRPVPQRAASNRKKPIIITMIIVIFVAILGLGGYATYTKKSDNLVGVNSGKYQALFLTNGQVYFGKLAKVDNDTIKISDIFYLQVQQAVQPKEGEDKQGETQLVKLGEELHGPEDEMFIDRDQVLFWENLKGSGKVTEAISQYKK